MDPGIPLLGFERERRRVEEGLRNRQPLLLLGPRGSGKTALLLACLHASPDAIYLPCRRVPHELLASLARLLGYDPGLSSIRLRGLLWTHFEANPRVLVLDGVDHPSHNLLRFFERLYYTPGMALLAAARDPVALGALHKLFWNPRNIVTMPPLDDGDARRLFEAATDSFRLRSLALEEFRDQVLDAAWGNPGEILAMCRLAADPRYQSCGRIKFVPLRIDALIAQG